MRKTVVLFLVFTGLLPGVLLAGAVTTWVSGHGKMSSSSDIEVGPDGKIWMVAGRGIWQKDVEKPINQQLTRFEKNTKAAEWNRKTGELVRYSKQGNKILVETLDPDNLDTMVGLVSRIAIDPDGRPWVVTKTNELYRKEGQIWKRLPMKLTDIAIGRSGAMWGLSDKFTNERGYTVLRYTGGSWEETGMTATSLAVDGTGEAWVISRREAKESDTTLFRHTSGGWQKMPGMRKPAAIASDVEGVIWVQGVDREHKTFPVIYKWSGSGWEERFYGAPGSFSITTKGYPVSAASYVPEGDIPVQRSEGITVTPGLGVKSFAIGKDDTVWAIRKFENPLTEGQRPEILKWNGQRFEPGIDTKKNLKTSVLSDYPGAIAVDGEGSPWILAGQGRESTLATLFRREGDTWVKADDRKFIHIRSDTDGVIWAAGTGVFRWDGKNLQQVGKTLPDYVTGFAIDKNKVPWVIYRASRTRAQVVNRLTPGGWEEVPIPAGLVLLSGGFGGGVDGSIWLTGWQGRKGALFQWTDTGWEKRSNAQMGQQITSDSKGRVWSLIQGAFIIVDTGASSAAATAVTKSVTTRKPAVPKKAIKPEKTAKPEKKTATLKVPAKAKKSPPLTKKSVPVKKQDGTVTKAALVGCWKWFNGAYIIVEKTGVVRNAVIPGTWVSNASGNGRYTITWPSIFDMVKLSSDGRSFMGANTFGMPVSGTRLSGAANGLPGEWLWMNGIKVSISNDKIVKGGPFQGRWQKTVDGYAIEWPIVDAIEVSANGSRLKGNNQFGPVAATRDKACAGP